LQTLAEAAIPPANVVAEPRRVLQPGTERDVAPLQILAERTISSGDVVTKPRRVLQPGAEPDVAADATAHPCGPMSKVVAQMRRAAFFAGVAHGAASDPIDHMRCASAQVTGVTHDAATDLAGVTQGAAPDVAAVLGQSAQECQQSSANPTGHLGVAALRCARGRAGRLARQLFRIVVHGDSPSRAPRGDRAGRRS
jgi:hypothetical protein